ncbi:glutathione S-transferase family protein [Nitratireductor pacificus]|nr:glutathione S-transferase family protein [Nitratireductor pacificus]
MSLTLHQHPLASFCHKVLIALYENGTAFDKVLVDLGDPASADAFRALWPLGKMPVLHDAARGATVPETSIIIEYLDLHHPGRLRMIPEDPEAALQVRLWDRFFDLHVSDPMQTIVLDRIRPDDGKDPHGVAAARAALDVAYALIDRQVANREWATGDAFTMADCSATPALFYAGIVHPFDDRYAAVAAYFERLIARPSARRVLAEAQPYFRFFPYRDAMPERFLRVDAQT